MSTPTTGSGGDRAGRAQADTPPPEDGPRLTDHARPLPPDVIARSADTGSAHGR
ncbi:hypothetical protein [Thermomonospora cellulosilytica]|uniref:Uncharacterized protein n=1 Tax=Thermomonospora cellulosilytica TaxID=1411118 RepID=A0A7W3N1U6_9ACTN|nr:hypothetical protein [Thermomonospora cellulosilytica]MBA9006006.1 hypothetical protein [Thermomonospora cellulosilytica]